MELFRLSAEDIMTATEESSAFLIENGIDRKDALKIQFAMEEVLLTYQQKFGEDKEFKLYLEKRFGRHRIILRIKGDAFDPFSSLDEDDRLMHNLMERMGKAPIWNYRRSCNEIVFAEGKKKSMSSMMKILIAVALSIGFGLLARLLPGDTAHVVGETWMAPVQNVIMGFLSCLSALFILLSVTSGICNMGDVSTFNRVGRKLIFRLMRGLLIVSVFVALALPLFFPLSDSGAGGADFSSLWQMIVNIIPTNIIETFSTGNTMQIVFLAIFSSVVLLVMGPKAQELVDIINQLSNLLLELIQKVIALMPLVVFISLFRVVADGNVIRFLNAYKYPLFILIISIVYLSCHVLLVSFRHHLSPFLLIKKLLPTMIIGVTTSSSAAALSENINTCEKRLGIDRQIINVGIPLGQTIYMPSVVIMMNVGILCAAQIFDVPISLSSFIILVITTYIIAIATPPMPGASLASFALLMTQMGIPADAMTFIVALDAIADRICTGTYIAGLQMQLVDIAKSVDLLDEKKLHSEE